MKKKLLTLLIGLMLMLSLSSCETSVYATTQDDIYVEAQADVVQSNVDFNIIVQYGTPYYYNGSLIYYVYRDLYYYPFYYNNYWYVRAYRRPFNHLHYRPYFRPHRYDYRFAPGSYKGFDRPRVAPRTNYRHVTPRTTHTPNRGTINRGTNRNTNRTPNRSSQRNNNGRFGGRR